jgi:TrpR-related protein YerC/YecD
MRLYEILAKLNTEEEIEAFFDDLCTYAEIEKMEQRIDAAQMFLEGATYNQVIKKTKISSATLSRVSRCIHHGSGGYSKILNRLVAEEKAKEATATDIEETVEE